MMINVYFILKGIGECVGGISLKEKHPTMNIDVWEVYKIYKISEKTVLFKRNEKEFCVTDGYFRHEMGQIEIKYIDNKWMNINVKEL